MMVQVSEMILGQFVENFRQTALAMPGGAAAAPATAGGASTAEASVKPQVAGEINGLAIFWALVKGWFSGIFGKRA